MIVTPNDYSQNGQWGPEHNEIIFQLPRDLINREGAIVINGDLSPNRKRYAFNLFCLPIFYVEYIMPMCLL